MDSSALCYFICYFICYFLPVFFDYFLTSPVANFELLLCLILPVFLRQFVADSQLRVMRISACCDRRLESAVF